MKVFKNLFFASLILSGIIFIQPNFLLAAPIDGCAGVVFSGDLKTGSVGQEVKCLQIVLNLDQATEVAKEGDGSPSKETDKLGKLTRAAVIRFQEKYADEVLKPASLKVGSGYVGKLTRAKLNEVLATTLGDKKLEVGQTLEGQASYYANLFQGKKTASGELYNKQEYTAAHKTLPFGTKVRVINQRNGRSAVVKVNDRVPFVAGRVIDLSQIAARDIGLLSAGVANVKVEVFK